MAALRSRLSDALEAREKRQMLRSLDPPAGGSREEDLVDFSSNDYLSLSRSKQLRTELLQALEDGSSSPYGPASSRLLDGNSASHRQLEARLSSFFRAESGLLFNSGFDANVGLWSCLPAADDYILYDELVHASTHDGMRASRVPQPRRRPFKHSDIDSLRSILLNWVDTDKAIADGTRSVWIGVEALYSMDGDIAPLREIVLCVEHCLPKGNGHIVVDEAHSTGIYGEQGRGLVCALGLANRVSIRLHTFGKAMACSGGEPVSSSECKQQLIPRFSRRAVRPAREALSHQLRSTPDLLDCDDPDERDCRPKEPRHARKRRHRRREPLSLAQRDQ